MKKAKFLGLDLTLWTIENKVKVARAHHISNFQMTGNKNIYMWPYPGKISYKLQIRQNVILNTLVIKNFGLMNFGQTNFEN